MMTKDIRSPLDILAEYIRTHGPIPTIRISSAPMRGRWVYWDIVPYEIRINSKGMVSSVACGRATSQWRSYAAATHAAERYAEQHKCIVCKAYGLLTHGDAYEILRNLKYLGKIDDALIQEARRWFDARAAMVTMAQDENE